MDFYLFFFIIFLLMFNGMNGLNVKIYILILFFKLFLFLFYFLFFFSTHEEKMVDRVVCAGMGSSNYDVVVVDIVDVVGCYMVYSIKQ